ncbi:MAG TPA: YdeI/OmpD-associated family protein [Vicinamibacterales bacterium]|nr:YdeI/OmpD-associated family protein [Vicinamibacterales bacterium]
MKTFDAGTIERWRTWLQKHHASASEIWLIHHKKHTGRPSVAHHDALDEALCYGWIDSLVKRIDDDRYAIKYTPRKPGSKWSAINRRRYAALEATGRLKAAGKARSPATGSRYDAKPKVPEKLPADIAKALKATPAAWAFFETLTPREQRMYFGWIHLAKREETKQRRLAEAIRLLSKKQKLGLK